MNKPVLQIVRGIPGSGKSSWTRDHFPGLILENDQFHCHSCIYEYDESKRGESIALIAEMAELALSHGMDVCIANTFTRRKYIDFYRNMAERYGANFRVMRMKHEFGSVHKVPEAVVDNMRSTFEDYPGEEMYDALNDVYYPAET